jgi:signal transduction histidine kinase
LVRRELDGRVGAERRIDQASSEVQRAKAVVASVLSLARGEPIFGESIPVGVLIGGARRAALLPEGVVFLVDVDPADLAVFGDGVLLERLLVNLYRNALEASPGRAVRVVTRARRTSGGVELEVEDDGPGFDPALKHRLFEPLASAKSGGTGLGLALCRAIARAHGGDLEATSDAKSERAGGALFRLSLPKQGDGSRSDPH